MSMRKSHATYPGAESDGSQDWHALTELERDFLRTGFLIHDVSRLRHRLLDTRVKSMVGITRHQWWLLVQLARHQEAIVSQVELARLVDMGKVPLGRTIDRLEEKGLLRRATGASDRRSKQVSLTPEGHDLVRRMRTVALELGQSIMDGIPRSRHRELNSILSRLKDNLQALGASSAGDDDAGE